MTDTTNAGENNPVSPDPPTLEEMVANLPPLGDDAYLRADVCAEFKKRHDTCFFKWYNTEFMEGKAKEAGCEPEWQAYQECVKRRLHKIDLSHLLKENQK
eukprot:CAMPEP_0201523716 /NCGR_PEP_ID=MMETSP0161_2-20130828/20869_1 /ASSEMBLY_ACC=CAM_ASM_000251 /TAXON_ID=180227 /ORGANISM="Neoparamoeba aestuarina, Strain SoJaBio B1-5/56/2" /LENGTH=99 /DNA_ID=CAMNT_0047922917 /DNA_START=58 /DNA_END=357 /DNA_ORIENTATION=+